MKSKVDKKRLKPYPAVLRVRHRYLLLEIRGGPFLKRDVEDALWKTVVEAVGVSGAAQADFSVLRLDDPEGGIQKGILRADSTLIDVIRGTVCMLREIRGAPCIVRVSRVSGTISHLK